MVLAADNSIFDAWKDIPLLQVLNMQSVERTGKYGMVDLDIREGDEWSVFYRPELMPRVDYDDDGFATAIPRLRCQIPAADEMSINHVATSDILKHSAYVNATGITYALGAANANALALRLRATCRIKARMTANRFSEISGDVARGRVRGTRSGVVHPEEDDWYKAVRGLTEGVDRSYGIARITPEAAKFDTGNEIWEKCICNCDSDLKRLLRRANELPGVDRREIGKKELTTLQGAPIAEILAVLKERAVEVAREANYSDAFQAVADAKHAAVFDHEGPDITVSEIEDWFVANEGAELELDDKVAVIEAMRHFSERTGLPKVFITSAGERIPCNLTAKPNGSAAGSVAFRVRGSGVTRKNLHGATTVPRLGLGE